MRTHLPSAWGSYVPTIWDWAVFGGTVGLFRHGAAAGAAGGADRVDVRDARAARRRRGRQHDPGHVGGRGAACPGRLPGSARRRSARSRRTPRRRCQGSHGVADPAHHPAGGAARRGRELRPANLLLHSGLPVRHRRPSAIRLGVVHPDRLRERGADRHRGRVRGLLRDQPAAPPVRSRWTSPTRCAAPRATAGSSRSGPTTRRCWTPPVCCSPDCTRSAVARDAGMTRSSLAAGAAARPARRLRRHDPSGEEERLCRQPRSALVRRRPARWTTGPARLRRRRSPWRCCSAGSSASASTALPATRRSATAAA